VEGIDVFGVKSLHQVFQFLKGEEEMMPVREDIRVFFESCRNDDVDSSFDKCFERFEPSAFTQSFCFASTSVPSGVNAS